MHRIGVFVYGVFSYVCFLATFLYAIGFVGGFGVPRSLDSAAAGPLATAVVVNVLLLSAFALQHSVMARPAFKRWWTSIVPEPAERSTYVLASSVALLFLFWQWRPIGGLVWQVEHPVMAAALYALFAAGWLTVLVTTFLINHFDLFGLRQCGSTSGASRTGRSASSLRVRTATCGIPSTSAGCSPSGRRQR